MVYTNNRWMTSFQRIPICFSQKIILIRKYLRNRNGFAQKGAIRVIAINRLLLSVYSVNIRLFFKNKFFFPFFLFLLVFIFFPSIFSYEILNKMCTHCEKIKHFYWKKNQIEFKMTLKERGQLWAACLRLVITQLGQKSVSLS